MNSKAEPSKDFKKLFLQTFEKLSASHSSWSVWQDFVTMSACAIANAVDKRPDIWQAREDEYLSIAKRYTKDETSDICNLFVYTTAALDENPRQDFLGDMYMELNLSNHWKGQFFTPWSVAELNSRLVMSGEDLSQLIHDQHYISICDPASGAGCILLAFANACQDEFDINYQESVLFVAQDVDPVVAKMCYIQMSLLGCPGYVVIGNTLTEPAGGTALIPEYKRPEDIWFTPFYFSTTWAMRRAIAQVLFLENEYTKQEAVVITKDEPKESPQGEKKSEPAPKLKPVSKSFYLKEFFKRRK